jgi:hypothetical protein
LTRHIFDQCHIQKFETNSIAYGAKQTLLFRATTKTTTTTTTATTTRAQAERNHHPFSTMLMLL